MARRFWLLVVPVIAVGCGENDPAPVTVVRPDAELRDFEDRSERLSRAMRANQPDIQQAIAGFERVQEHANRLLRREDLGDERKASIRKRILDHLRSLVPFAGQRFADLYEEYADETVERFPQSEAAAMVTAFRLLDEAKSVHPREAELVPKFVDLAERFPGTAFGYDLLMFFAQRAEQAGEPAKAMEALSEAARLYPARADAPEHHQRRVEHAMKWVGQPMEFVGETLEGEEFSLETLRGKVVLVEFWGLESPSCVAHVPIYRDLQERFGDSLAIVGVPVVHDRNRARQFAETHGADWPHVVPPGLTFGGWQNPIVQRYEVKALPAVFLLDKEHTIVGTGVGGEFLAERIAELSQQ